MSRSRNIASREMLNSQLDEARQIIADLPRDDVFGRLSLEGVVLDLEADIERLASSLDRNLALAEIVFTGKPVRGSQSVEAEFAATAIAEFQDVVSKHFATSVSGLGARGVVPDKAASALHITGTLAGSFGFVLEEVGSNSLVESTLSKTVDASVELLEAFAEEDEEKFAVSTENLNQRLLESVRKFLGHLSTNGSGLKLSTGDTITTLTRHQISAAVERADRTEVLEDHEQIIGRLTGLMSDGHQFEISTGDSESQKYIKGQVSRSFTSQQIERWLSSFSGQVVSADVYVKRIKKFDELVSENYILNDLKANSSN